MSNLPIDVVRCEPDADRLCLAIELLSAARQRRTTFAEAVARRQELLLVNQSRWFLEAYAREDRIRNTLQAVLNLIPEELRDKPEIGSWFYDYSEQAIMTRRQAGNGKARDALNAFRGGRTPAATAFKSEPLCWA